MVESICIFIQNILFLFTFYSMFMRNLNLFMQADVYVHIA